MERQNNGGTEQFAVSIAEGVRFAGSGATSVSLCTLTKLLQLVQQILTPIQTQLVTGGLTLMQMVGTNENISCW